MEKLSEKQRVLVTGATGYLAGHVIQILLKNNYIVRGSVRDIKNTQKYQHLIDLNTQLKGELEFCQANLLKSGTWDEATKNCQYVIHIASPFPTEVPKNENEIIRPAVHGTINVVRAAIKNNVKRIVLTSSIAAILSTNLKKGVFDESDWANLQTAAPYEKSKTIAEMAAWRLVKENQGQIELVSICPGFLLGPPLVAAESTSQDIISKFMTNQFPAIPKLQFQLVDVRDVAQAHYLALIKPEAAGQRYIIVENTYSAEQLLNILQDEYKKYGYKFPKLKVGKFVMQVGGMFKRDWKYFVPFIEKNLQVSNSKSQKELKLEYIPIQQSLVDMTNKLIEFGQVPNLIKNSVKPKL